MSKGTNFAFKSFNVLAWIIFIGLCIETGGLIVNAIISLFINPMASSRFWGNRNLYELYQFNQSHFITIVVLLIIVSILKSILFYLIVNLFHKKKLNLNNPFNEQLGRSLFNIGYLALGIGLFSWWGNNFSKWLKMNGQTVLTNTFENIKFEGADVWLFMAIILLVFGMIFKKGIELQSENDLTV
jgi:ABC-type multidrug transport system fused ATPase/permease subunit